MSKGIIAVMIGAQPISSQKSSVEQPKKPSKNSNEIQPMLSTSKAILQLQVQSAYSEISIAFVDRNFAETFKYDEIPSGKCNCPIMRLYPFAVEGYENTLTRIFESMHSGIPFSEFTTLVRSDYFCLRCRITVFPLNDTIKRPINDENAKIKLLPMETSWSQVAIPDLLEKDLEDFIHDWEQSDNGASVADLNSFLLSEKLSYKENSFFSRIDQQESTIQQFNQMSENVNADSVDEIRSVNDTDLISNSQVLTDEDISQSNSERSSVETMVGRTMYAVLSVRCSNLVENFGQLYPGLFC